MTETDLVSKRHELDELKSRVRQLETEVAEEEAKASWRATGYYGMYYATTGFMLGIFGACVSLLVNVIGAPIAGKNPLELIRIYLTFPLGEKALQLTDQADKIYAIPDGMILAIGCTLYLATGMVLGVPFQLVLERFAPDGSLVRRFVVGTVLSIAIWLFNFYVLLAWLQPALFGGNWIVERIPWWVAMTTHLVFGWTMVLLYPLGQYVPYRRPTEQA